MRLDVGRWISETGAARGTGGQVSGWSVDTRTLQAGDLYFALRGPSHDGHDYVADAIRKGAAGVVVDRPVDGMGDALVVRDTLQALQSLAAWARKQWGGEVIGVTGSAGKTTTKDAVAELLSTEMKVGKTIGNLNNHVGTPLSILRLPDDCRVAVLELGMNHAGEIRALAEIARPDVGVVTNVGYAHTEFFENIDGVAAAKRELIDALPARGTAVLNADDSRVSRFLENRTGELPRRVTFGFSRDAGVRAESLELFPGCSRFKVGAVPFEIPLPGRHGVMNALAAIAVAGVYGIPPERLTGAARSLSAGKMRGERIVRDGITILNDCYNSNPEAVRAMVDVLGATPARRRLAVLGEMLELGHSAEPLHREIGRYVAGRGIDVLLGIRGASRHMVDEAVRAGMSGAAYFFEDSASAGDFLRDLAREGDAVLFKGSRGVAVENAMERLLAGAC
ncbi:MAG TPA: UDP-N-acetylmuramoyl-tripeptide--D-alanyl-D-alanine ligase [Bryobacteraceae bacterium]|nr:UDP-N-acetylmuramoyl-tripeptide--D-alanyl-D-alanine ligase [Bryobacteraceae bacterium]